VQKNCIPVFDGKEGLIEDPETLITPFGGIALLTHFFGKVEHGNACKAAMPYIYFSPNAIPPVHSSLAFLLSVLNGVRIHSHGIQRRVGVVTDPFNVMKQTVKMLRDPALEAVTVG